jgi:hypothetical protein
MERDGVDGLFLLAIIAPSGAFLLERPLAVTRMSGAATAHHW